MEDYYLKPGYVYVTRDPVIIQTVLGSCVSICLYDCVLKYGGMNHYLYAYCDSGRKGTTQSGLYAIRELYNTFMKFGSAVNNLTSHVAGGAHIAGNAQSEKIAHDNVMLARKMLSTYHIRIASENVGGTEGRKLVFYTALNKIDVSVIKYRDMVMPEKAYEAG